MSTSSNHIRSANTNKKQTPQFSLPSLRQKSGSHNKSPYDNNNFNNYINSQNKNYHKPYSGNPTIKYNQKTRHFFYNNKKVYHRDITTANPNNPILIKNIFYNIPSNINYNNYNYFLHNNKKQRKVVSSSNLNPSANNNNGSFRQKINFAKSLPRTKGNTNINSNAGLNINVFNSLSINPGNKILTPSSRGTTSHSSSNQKAFKEYFYKEEKNLEHRKTMEDFHSIVPQFGNDTTKSYFSIFDGHSGTGPATYCKDNLHSILSKYLYMTNFNVEKSLINSFTKIDKDINDNSTKNDEGTTATVIFLFQEYNSQKRKNQRVLFCANVGDSKSYLIEKNGNVIQLSKDHKCTDTKEVERIKKSGGIVFGGRVFGTLMLTRSIGDKEMKKYGVVSTPTVNRREIDEERDKYVVIASDGVWDVVNVDLLSQMAKEENAAQSLCEKIVKAAIDGDTRDNVSCIVIKL